MKLLTKTYCLSIIIFISFRSVHAQNSSTFNVETGLFYSFGLYNNPVINIGDYHDQVYLILGYQKVKTELNYSIRLGLMEDNLGEEKVGSKDS